jgi:tRNA nucleotidyltransferase (CCA-adding enzyme)
MKMFEVGGCVRDEILGVASKDIDFTVVLDDEFAEDGFNRQGNTPFEVMTLNLRKMGFKIFLETPEFLTVRAQFPDDGKTHYTNRLTADFVLARKEGDYTDGRRPDKVIPGTLMDDLARRDFTMNAVAKGSDGSLIDPFNGRDDIDARIIRAVGDPVVRLREDALRAVRALRFSVTKGFEIDPHLKFALEAVSVLDAVENKISDERIQVELSKMFRFDTVASLFILNEFPHLTRAMFAGSVSLDATMKTKGRG